jgi:acetyl esterase/lipase
VALGVLAGLTAAVARRARTISAVAPDLWLPLSIGSRLELEAGRRTSGARVTEPVAGVTVTRSDVPGGQDVVVYEPAERTGGALLWVHGGGTVLGRPEGDSELCSRMARDLGIVVVNARYRLAPEHPFPAALDDLLAALRHLHARAADLGVDPARIAVGGASAGGGLAAAVAQRATDEGVPVAFQLLVHPMLDDRTVLRRGTPGRGRLVWTPRSNRWAWTAYLGHEPRADEQRPYAAPARRLDPGCTTRPSSSCRRRWRRCGPSSSACPPRSGPRSGAARRDAAGDGAPLRRARGDGHRLALRRRRAGHRHPVSAGGAVRPAGARAAGRRRRRGRPGGPPGVGRLRAHRGGRPGAAPAGRRGLTVRGRRARRRACRTCTPTRRPG